ncbi:hypothetical protein QQX98_010905 [Neonectria punicea]|uniref:Uncharacterized protein n=1 Tax=Neonectria punicea TaxID=979145 RepID=A0ABR1GN22_9HYPO
MLLPTLIRSFPAVGLAARLPFVLREATNQDDCTSTSTLPPVTFTSLAPASTLGGQSPSVSREGGSLIYTTAFPTLGTDGLGVHTYTVTIPCPGTTGSPCRPLDPSECPPGFTTSAVACTNCGPSVVTTVLTLPLETVVSSGGPVDVPTYTKVNGGTSHVTQTRPASESPAASAASSDVPDPTATDASGGSGSGSSAFGSGSQSADVSSPTSPTSPTSTNASSVLGSSSGSGSTSPGSESLGTQSVDSASPQPTTISSEDSGNDSTPGSSGGLQGDSGAFTTSSAHDTFSTLGSSSISSEETAAATPSAIQVAGSASVFVDMKSLFAAFSLACVLAQLRFYL